MRDLSPRGDSPMHKETPSGVPAADVVIKWQSGCLVLGARRVEGPVIKLYRGFQYTYDWVGARVSRCAWTDLVAA